MSWKTIDNPLFQFEQSDEFAKFHFDFATASPPAELFHYTSGESLLAIIQSQCMFATERSFLNDPTEFDWGLRAIHEYLETAQHGKYSVEFLEQIDAALQEETDVDLRLFVLSLSANPDLLSQWRAYARDGQGYALGLSGHVLRDRSGFGEYVLGDINLDAMPKEFVYCFHLLPVIYEKQAQADLLIRFVDAAYSFWKSFSNPKDPKSTQVFRLMVQHRMKEILISCKNPGYKEESEWRIVATVHKESEKIEFRHGRFGITPYVRLNLSGRHNIPHLTLPMTTIWAGPKSPAKQNALGLNMLCQSKNAGVQLKLSRIDYRT